YSTRGSGTVTAIMKKLRRPRTCRSCNIFLPPKSLHILTVSIAPPLQAPSCPQYSAVPVDAPYLQHRTPVPFRTRFSVARPPCCACPWGYNDFRIATARGRSHDPAGNHHIPPSPDLHPYDG